MVLNKPLNTSKWIFSPATDLHNYAKIFTIYLPTKQLKAKLRLIYSLVNNRYTIVTYTNLIGLTIFQIHESSLWIVYLNLQGKMNPAQQLLLKLAKLVQELLQQLPYWWKLPIVLMMFYQFRQRDYLMNNNLFDSYPCQDTGPKYDCQDPIIGKYC